MTFVWGVLVGLVIGIAIAFTPVGDAIFQLRAIFAWVRGQG